MFDAHETHQENMPKKQVKTANKNNGSVSFKELFCKIHLF